MKRHDLSEFLRRAKIPWRDLFSSDSEDEDGNSNNDDGIGGTGGEEGRQMRGGPGHRADASAIDTSAYYAALNESEELRNGRVVVHLDSPSSTLAAAPAPRDATRDTPTRQPVALQMHAQDVGRLSPILSPQRTRHHQRAPGSPVSPQNVSRRSVSFGEDQVVYAGLHDDDRDDDDDDGVGEAQHQTRRKSSRGRRAGMRTASRRVVRRLAPNTARDKQHAAWRAEAQAAAQIRDELASISALLQQRAASLSQQEADLEERTLALDQWQESVAAEMTARVEDLSVSHAATAEAEIRKYREAARTAAAESRRTRRDAAKLWAEHTQVKQQLEQAQQRVKDQAEALSAAYRRCERFDRQVDTLRTRLNAAERKVASHHRSRGLNTSTPVDASMRSTLPPSAQHIHGHPDALPPEALHLLTVLLRLVLAPVDENLATADDPDALTDLSMHARPLLSAAVLLLPRVTRAVDDALPMLLLQAIWSALWRGHRSDSRDDTVASHQYPAIKQLVHEMVRENGGFLRHVNPRIRVPAALIVLRYASASASLLLAARALRTDVAADVEAKHAILRLRGLPILTYFLTHDLHALVAVVADLLLSLTSDDGFVAAFLLSPTWPTDCATALAAGLSHSWGNVLDAVSVVLQRLAASGTPAASRGLHRPVLQQAVADVLRSPQCSAFIRNNLTPVAN